MKRFLSLFLCVSLLGFAMVSCEEKPNGGPDEPTTVTLTLNANFGGTAASMASALSTGWTDDAAISVFAGKKNARFDVVSVDGETAVFKGETETATSYYALYPYNEDATQASAKITVTVPAEQSVINGKLDPSLFICVGKVEDDAVEFNDVLAYAEIAVEGENLESISLTAENIVGKAKFTADNGKVTLVKGEGAVTSTGAIKSGDKYYMAVLPGTYDLVLSAKNNKGLTAELESQKITFTAGKTTSLTAAFGEEAWVLRPNKNMSYVLNGADEVEAFNAVLPTPKEDVIKLEIHGSDVTDALLAETCNRVGSIETIVWDGLGATTTEGFFDAIEIKKGVTITNCASLTSLSGFAAYTAVGGDFVISGCDKIVYGELPFESVAGKLSIDGAALAPATLKNIVSVGGAFEILNSTDALTSFEGCQLSTVAGDLHVEGNAALVSLKGLDKIGSIGGNVVVFDNGAIPEISTDEAVGYCIFREYFSKSVIAATANVKIGTTAAPVDFANLPSCDGTRPGDPQSYVLTGDTEIQSFIDGAGAEKEIVNNLTIIGGTPGVVKGIGARVKQINGWFTLKDTESNPDEWGCGTDNFMEQFIVDGVYTGSIHMDGMKGIINPNGFEPMKKITGSLIVENCNFRFTWSTTSALTNLEEVGGDLVLRNILTGNEACGGPALKSLKKVGGTFEMTAVTAPYTDKDGNYHEGQNFWSMGGMDYLTYIGGDLILQDNLNFWGLQGFDKLTYLGGNVVVKNYGKLQTKNGTVDGYDCVGLCIFRDYYDGGVMNPNATVTISPKEGEYIDFADIKSCSYVGDEDKNGDGESFDEEDPVTGWK